VRDDFRFEDGLFTGYDADKRQYDKTSWHYELDENGHLRKRDTTLTHPRCVWNLLKHHVSAIRRKWWKISAARRRRIS
jgi:formate dehydrogenase major subunit